MLRIRAIVLLLITTRLMMLAMIYKDLSFTD
jgi:hypothetical protein